MSNFLPARKEAVCLQRRLRQPLRHYDSFILLACIISSYFKSQPNMYFYELTVLFKQISYGFSPGETTPSFFFNKLTYLDFWRNSRFARG